MAQDVSADATGRERATELLEATSDSASLYAHYKLTQRCASMNALADVLKLANRTQEAHKKRSQVQVTLKITLDSAPKQLVGHQKVTKLCKNARHAVKVRVRGRVRIVSVLVVRKSAHGTPSLLCMLAYSCRYAPLLETHAVVMRPTHGR